MNNVKSKGTDINILNKIEQSAASRYPQSDWYSMAVYIMGNYKLSEATKIEIGIRYNQYILNTKFDTIFYKFS
jgi:hemoglobin/transferrin/lactoferrin receptor protein